MPALPSPESPSLSADSQARLPWDDCFLTAIGVTRPLKREPLLGNPWGAPPWTIMCDQSSSSNLLPCGPRPIYERYWYFAAERQEIFHNRLLGMPAPWTLDPILANYKFTNAYRASDRVSQYLIRHVIYRDESTR